MGLKKWICTLVLAGILLGVHNGNIAVWLDGNPDPAKVFPIPALLLPREDRRILEKGIRVDDISDLTKLLEDYLS